MALILDPYMVKDILLSPLRQHSRMPWWSQIANFAVKDEDIDALSVNALCLVK